MIWHLMGTREGREATKGEANGRDYHRQTTLFQLQPTVKETTRPYLLGNSRSSSEKHTNRSFPFPFPLQSHRPSYRNWDVRRIAILNFDFAPLI